MPFNVSKVASISSIRVPAIGQEPSTASDRFRAVISLITSVLKCRLTRMAGSCPLQLQRPSKSAADSGRPLASRSAVPVTPCRMDSHHVGRRVPTSSGHWACSLRSGRSPIVFSDTGHSTGKANSRVCPTLTQRFRTSRTTRRLAARVSKSGRPNMRLENSSAHSRLTHKANRPTSVDAWRIRP
jgi:hypothetical protein